MCGDTGEDFPDAYGEVDVVLEDECGGDVFVDHLAPDVGMGAPAAEFGASGGFLWGFIEIVG